MYKEILGKGQVVATKLDKNLSFRQVVTIKRSVIEHCDTIAIAD